MKPTMQKVLNMLAAVAILSLYIAFPLGIGYAMEERPREFGTVVNIIAILAYILLVLWATVMFTLSFMQASRGMVLDTFLATTAARVALPILYLMTCFFITFSYDPSHHPLKQAYVVSSFSFFPVIALTIVSVLVRSTALKTFTLVLAGCFSILTILVSPAIIQKSLDYIAESWLFSLQDSRTYIILVVDGLLIYVVYRLYAKLIEWYEYEEIARIADTFHKRGGDEWKLTFEHQLKAREFMRSLGKNPLAEKSRELFPEDYVLQKTDFEMNQMR